MTYDSTGPWWEENPFPGNGHDPDGWPKIEDRLYAVFKGREFLREADGVWRDERGATIDIVNGKPEITEIANTRTRTTARSLHGLPVPNQTQWFMDEWLVRGQCNGLYGVPGVRKSLLMLQAQIAGSLGAEFCGVALPYSTTLGYYGEDALDPIHYRAEKILRLGYAGRDFDAPGMENCHWHSMVGAIHTDFMTFFRSGTPRFSPEWRWMTEELNDLQPDLFNLDVAPHFFGGNEIVRREVHAFVRTMDSVLQPIQCAGLMSFHPSLTGIATRKLTSGSTGWEGAFRSRLGLYDPTHDEDPDDDEPRMRPFTNQRNLIRFKSNYAKEGEEIPLEVIDNAYFIAAGQIKETFARGSRLWQSELNNKFWSLFDKATQSGKTLTDSINSPYNLGATFVKMPDRGKYTKADFNAAAEKFVYAEPPLLKLVPTSGTVNKYQRV